MFDSYNPSSETAAAYLADLVWAIPVSLATTKGMISFPPATEMFQFAGLPPHGLCVQPWVTGHDPSRVSPFGDLRIKVCLPTPRSLSQATTSFIASYRLGIHRMRLFA